MVRLRRVRIDAPGWTRRRAGKGFVYLDVQRVRVGVHVGDVMLGPNGDLLGHSVNVAARLQQLAKPGAVLVSMDVRRAVRGRLQQRLHAAGVAQLDKMAEAIEIASAGADGFHVSFDMDVVDPQVAPGVGTPAT